MITDDLKSLKNIIYPSTFSASCRRVAWSFRNHSNMQMRKMFIKEEGKMY